MSNDNLKRFLDAQQRDYATALTEIKSGHKIPCKNKGSAFLRGFTFLFA